MTTPKALTLKPPSPLTWPPHLPSLFLAGSIELDRAQPWQQHVEATLADLDIVILNPRRDDWDNTWRQRADDPRFLEQVTWELDALTRASIIAMHFDPATKSPISLLELGLFASSNRLAISCPETFWRRGNVEIVCARAHIPLFDSLDDLLTHLRTHLTTPTTSVDPTPTDTTTPPMLPVDHTEAAPGIGIIGIDHVQLAMPRGEEAKARAFYAGALGLTEVPKPEPLASRGGCWFRGSGLELHLGVEDPFRPARKAHPALRVTYLPLAAARLTQAGVHVKPDDALAGRFFVDDPFGNRIEIVAWSRGGA